MKDFSRRLVAENNLGTNDLILPLFVCEGNNVETLFNQCRVLVDIQLINFYIKLKKR